MNGPGHPPALPHEPIEALFEDVFLVHGTVRMGPLMAINRNMVILREDGELTLVNPVRLSEAEKRRLEDLGAVKRVMRLGFYHGMDDAYYVDRFGCEFWCQGESDHYPEPRPTHLLDEDTKLPLSGAELFVFGKATAPEAALLIRRHKLLITTDSIQNHAGWSHVTPVARLVMLALGFRLEMLIGPVWLKYVTPKGDTLEGDFRRLLELDFENLIGAHGRPCRGNAKPKLQAAMAKAFGRP